MPRVVFKFSSVYNNTFRQFLGEAGNDYPSVRKIKNYIEDIKPLWVELEKDVFPLIAKISHLKRKDAQISCYIV